ncbi:MAG TPA: zf-HC2 domain-containing protein, partial [Chthoniobacteraceae bacterium]|nr:zf-HC2 domain-containing protein [Chthoniobacteraceae bacterium]
MPNETIHDEIEEWLAADVHDQLSDEERAAFQRHLAVCDSCQALQGEVKQMHQLLENTLATESADAAFEQRMVRRFRDKIPERNGGLSTFFAGLIRMRAAQITAVAALLLTLVQVGRMVTGEGESPRRSPQPVEFASVTTRDERKAEAQGTITN